MIDAVTAWILTVGLIAIGISLYMLMRERKQRKEDRRAGLYPRDAAGRFTSVDVSKEEPTIKKTEKT